MKDKNKNKRKKIVLMISVIIILVMGFMVANRKTTLADSGFSASYSGGGSSSSYSSSSSSYSSSSSSNSSSSSSSSRGSSSTKKSGLVTILMIPVMFLFSVGGPVIFTVLMVKLLTKSNRSRNMYTTPVRTKLDDSEIKNIIPNFNSKEFLEEAFDIYKRVQIAWMNFDLDSVRDVITDEMYNMYSSQLDTLSVKGEKNIMENMILQDSYVSAIKEQNGIVTLTVISDIKQNDYIIDEKTGNVLRGNKNTVMYMTYELKFAKSLNAKVDKCPNCGADLGEMNGSTVCQYCGSKIVSDGGNWVLTEKNAIAQR